MNESPPNPPEAIITKISQQSPDNSKNLLKNIGGGDLWDQIGFHRPIGGFWFKMLYQILDILLPAIIVAALINILYPFPESTGYKMAITGMFSLIFQIFDLGTVYTIDRFVAEANIKNPEKMVQYVQYFIWYQSFTGLIQTTLISVWAIVFVPQTDLAYAIWIILIYSTTQFPGYLGVFNGLLNALQQFSHKATVDFIQSEAIQRITEIAFVLLGKIYGQAHPEIGALMGIAIGAVIGLYVDDFIAAVLAGYFISRSLKKFGITFRRCFYIEFDLKLVKECFFFGVKTGLPGLLNGVTQFLALTLRITYIPQYTTYIVLSDMAFMLVATVGRLTNQDFTPLITESYLNDKKQLTQYYMSHILRFYMINQGFAFAILIATFTMFEMIFTRLSLDRYLLTLPFIIPNLFLRASRPYTDFPNSIIVAANRPNILLILRIIEEVGKIVSLWLAIVVFRMQDLGIGGIVYTLVFGDMLGIILKTVIAFLYIHKKIVPFRLLGWQTFGVPILATLILFSVFQMLRIFVLNRFFDQYFYLTLTVAFILLLVLGFFFYFPLTVILGGWDNNSIRDFSLARKMAGPSTFIVAPIYYLVMIATRISPLHNRFTLDTTKAYKELEELVEIREKNRKKVNIEA